MCVVVNKLNVAILILCLLLTCGLTSRAAAESLKVTVSESVSRHLPDAVKRIIRALDATGYEIEVIVLPDKRALLWAGEGKLAMELYRTPLAIADIASLTAIQPPVGSLTFGMVTSSKTPEMCALSEENFKNLSVVGLLGIELYDHYYYPRFKSFTVVSDIVNALKLVSLQRADVTFFPQGRISVIPDEISDLILVCETNFKQFPFHSFIHEDFLWAKDKIEAAYRMEFGSE